MGLLGGLLDYYRDLGLESHIAQALFILGIFAVGGIIFIFFFALHVPCEMSLVNMTVANATNATIPVETGTKILSSWDSAFSVISVFGVGVLVAGGSFFLGGLLGFLFGIPKMISQPAGGDNTARTSQQYRANTNLEDISDWLTKIVIGVGLVELSAVPSLLDMYAKMIAPALGGVPSSGAVAIAIFLYYSLVGFLIVYLATRGYMESDLEKQERMELYRERVEKLEKELQLDQRKLEAESNLIKMNNLAYEKDILELTRRIQEMKLQTNSQETADTANEE
ncbi:MAG TPA: hypothetical protein HA264_06350 [Methanolinea sp.]|nr:hypothetical protein [Methanolinea sp.]